MKKILLSFLLMITTAVSYGQIGYQVSLLNTATGEPRANETVSCNVTLTNSEGGVIYSGTQSATSNDFGVVSLNVGNATMFDNMDWSKLPLFIEVSVDGKLIGKSQVLSVPVAEYAKKTGVLNWEILSKVNIVSPKGSNAYLEYIFGETTVQIREYRLEMDKTHSWWEYKVTHECQYQIVGDIVTGSYDYNDGYYDNTRTFLGIYSSQLNTLIILNSADYSERF